MTKLFKIFCNNKPIFKLLKKIYGLEKVTDIYLSDYLKKVPKLVNNEIKNMDESEINQHSDYVWSMWLQGNPPKIVQACLNSVQKIYPNLIIITSNNIKEYIEIPPYIQTRLDKKQMTRTNFSDWVRAALLDKYGGIWFDATVLLTQNLPHDMTQDSFNLLRTKKGGISSWLIKSNKNNYLIKSMRIYMEEYWKDTNFIFDYFMFHKFFVRYVKQNETAKKLYEKIKFYGSKPAFMICNKSFHNGYGHLGEDYDENYYNKVKETYFVQKLTYKDKDAEKNPNSYYWHIVNEYTDS